MLLRAARYTTRVATRTPCVEARWGTDYRRLVSRRAFSALEGDIRPGNVIIWGSGPLGVEGSASSSSSMMPGGLGNKVEPTLLQGLVGKSMRKVRVGEKVGIACTRSGSVFTWGQDKFALGHGGKISESLTPRRIAALKGIEIVDVGVGSRHCAAVSSEGEVFTWGFGGGGLTMSQGALGHGDRTHQPRPALVDWFQQAGVKAVRVACGGSHTAVLSTEGRLFCFGEGESGRLGNGVASQSVPVEVDFPDPETRCVHVTAGNSFTMALDTHGRLWGFGKNGAGQLALGENAVIDVHASEAVPQQVALLSDLGETIVDVEAGERVCIALSQSGRLYVWGDRQHLSPFEVTDLPFLKRATSLAQDVEDGTSSSSSHSHSPETTQDQQDDERVVRIAAGGGAFGVLSSKGRVVTWGKNLMTGATGHNSSMGTGKPTFLSQLEPYPCRALFMGPKFGAAIVGKPPTKPLGLAIPTLPQK